jgi:hypothetical protein
MAVLVRSFEGFQNMVPKVGELLHNIRGLPLRLGLCIFELNLDGELILAGEKLVD